jgi:hypothetical protein
MALVPSAFAQIIQTQLMAVGAQGSNMLPFCTAVATGIINSVKGKSFQTLDVGTVPGIGKGTGTGILGLMPNDMAQIGLAMAPSMAGSNAMPMMLAVMNATQEYFAAAASLSSTDTPVFLGSGTMITGTLMVDMDDMTSNLKSAFTDAGAKGKNMPTVCMAISAGVTFGLLTMATGALVIVGTATGTPVPGGGSGMGEVS